MSEDLKDRLLKQREDARQARAADPMLVELQATMAVVLAKLRDAYSSSRPAMFVPEVLGDIVYEATFLRKRKDEVPEFDTAALEAAVETLISVFGTRGMTRDLALAQIVYDATVAGYAPV
jgi:hypothetical protein